MSIHENMIVYDKFLGNRSLGNSMRETNLDNKKTLCNNKRGQTWGFEETNTRDHGKHGKTASVLSNASASTTDVADSNHHNFCRLAIERTYRECD